MTAAVAVFDVGKTNAKLLALTGAGEPLEVMTTPNRVLDGPPYRHHDLDGMENWLLDGLRALGERHPIEAVVTCTHGGSGVLVGEDAAAMPLIDYEQAPPPEIDAAYRTAASSFRERGSVIMLGSAHPARQLLWLETGWPEAVAGARAFLNLPQYWAWRLSGVTASEVTSLGAQSHLWCVPERRPSAIVEDRGWGRLLPPLRPAWASLGPLTPAVRARTGLGPGVRVLNGIHDSSANFYRYLAAGLSDFAVVSTGTWIVALTDRPGADLDTQRPGFSCNADVHGNPVAGKLTMGGREFSAVADGATGPATREALARLVAAGTFALPFFGSDAGLFPRGAGAGRILGPAPEGDAGRFSLAVLYTAMLAAEGLERLPPAATVILDGNFVKDPLFAAVVQALLPGRAVRVNRDSLGTQAGAALLATHETRTAPAPLRLEPPEAVSLPDLPAYRARWRALAQTPETSS